jgi:hypothetical protein
MTARDLKFATLAIIVAVMASAQLIVAGLWPVDDWSTKSLAIGGGSLVALSLFLASLIGHTSGKEEDNEG